MKRSGSLRLLTCLISAFRVYQLLEHRGGARARPRRARLLISGTGEPESNQRGHLLSSILPVGDVLPVDAEGYLVNPCRSDLIVPPWSDVVAAVRAAYLQHLAEKVHSLYLRGSVAKGTAIPGVSDVDTFAVILGEREAIDPTWIGAFRHRMANQFPFHTGIELEFVSHQAVCDAKAARGSRFLIKTQCVCLWGEDLAPSIPPYRPGRDLAEHAFEIKQDKRQVMERLPALEGDPTVRGWCQWIMKRLVRTGFELVMEQEQAYTRDLYPCYVAFCRHFPAQEQQMKQALEWAIAPSDDKEAIAQFLDDFGAWIVKAVAEEFPNTLAASE